jgi:hypothetical protein
MGLAAVRVLAIACIALYLVPTGAHFFELANKLALPPSDYMVVQRIYRGWAWFGIVGVFALLLTLLHAILRRARRSVFVLSLAAFLCMAGTQAIFGVFTYPINVASDNWTTLPPQFNTARMQWEYSHAASAMLTFLALLLIAAAIAIDRRSERT